VRKISRTLLLVIVLLIVVTPAVYGVETFPVDNYVVLTYISESGAFGGVRAIPAHSFNLLLNMFFWIATMIASLATYITRERLDLIS